jgi:hypothetical protein
VASAGFARKRTRVTREITPRTLVMVGDDDEVRLEHAIEMYRSLPTANSPSFPVPRMAC